jgi:predicted O-methyltransferase YrrM
MAAICVLAIDPLQAPLWAVVASLTYARRILEVGGGHGYTAAVMASMSKADCSVDTIEADPDHADLAEQAFQQRGLSSRIRFNQSFFARFSIC